MHGKWKLGGLNLLRIVSLSYLFIYFCSSYGLTFSVLIGAQKKSHQRKRLHKRENKSETGCGKCGCVIYYPLHLTLKRVRPRVTVIWGSWWRRNLGGKKERKREPPAQTSLLKILVARMRNTSLMTANRRDEKRSIAGKVEKGGKKNGYG